MGVSCSGIALNLILMTVTIVFLEKSIANLLNQNVASWGNVLVSWITYLGWSTRMNAWTDANTIVNVLGTRLRRRQIFVKNFVIVHKLMKLVQLVSVEKEIVILRKTTTTRPTTRTTGWNTTPTAQTTTMNTRPTSTTRRTTGISDWTTEAWTTGPPPYTTRPTAPTAKTLPTAKQTKAWDQPQQLIIEIGMFCFQSQWKFKKRNSKSKKKLILICF